MFVTITDAQSGVVVEQFEIGDDETLDPKHYANTHAQNHGLTVEPIDDFAGDITVEIADVPQSAVCWVCRDFKFIPVDTAP